MIQNHPKHECKHCGELKDARGFGSHQTACGRKTRNPRFMKAGKSERKIFTPLRPESVELEEKLSNIITRDTIAVAIAWFPTNPFLFNAVIHLSSVKDDFEPVKSLESVKVMVELAIEQELAKQRKLLT